MPFLSSCKYLTLELTISAWNSFLLSSHLLLRFSFKQTVISDDFLFYPRWSICVWWSNKDTAHALNPLLERLTVGSTKNWLWGISGGFNGSRITAMTSLMKKIQLELEEAKRLNDLGEQKL